MLRHIINMFFSVFLRYILYSLLHSTNRLIRSLMSYYIVISVLFLHCYIFCSLFRHIIYITLLHWLVFIIYFRLRLRLSNSVMNRSMRITMVVGMTLTIVSVTMVRMKAMVGMRVA